MSRGCSTAGAYQPREKVGDFIIGYADTVEASAQATSVPDLFERLEACGGLVRVDTSVEPTMFRAPFLSEYERDLLRTIEHVVRAGPRAPDPGRPHGDG